MNIISRAVTTTANETTKQGYYEIEYLCEAEELKRVHIQLFTPPSELSDEHHYLGHILMENGTMQCSLSEHLDYAPIIADFESFMQTIKASLTANN